MQRGTLVGGTEMTYHSMQADLYQRMEHMRRAEMERDADEWRLLHERRTGRPWFTRSGCWLLCQAGRELVVLGRALQSLGRYHSDVMRT